ncbi:zinc-dependent alcohol dehydrogenase [Agrobacterium rosae]|uniref:Alcohol dehydrogenase n=1 Tax=Agrobacterium rosae TaxID=1972867 RepID=A0AAE5VN85_9HYPH|nr:alcohol dehydrogenase catalytic domain-containing protein [Agrobacterium rosae]KAA3515413.1 alcohol dehydrogenase [Agrobacterium rosae]KAA3524379.1 alcohol dehydrogenase [Agrobacterium rosae]MBN7804327.1 alcohol dehydrogenase catalytic domain-containing protein [Agrobacterium rosae]MCM2431280.1 alcohol dehydrogenase catalytic domain-containing protein [Agrobacterium rosae]MDX8329054.1 alcohol dehydrogenase catalytic domain-containing protein [Agrobacterium rosae]
MLALQKVRPGSGVQFNTIAQPDNVAAGEVLIRVHSAGICGTDLHIAQWTPGYESMESVMPITLGHEFSGMIEQAGTDVPADAIGTPVTARPSTTCGSCNACLAGDEDNCTRRKGVGIGRSGAFTSYVCVPYKNCHALPDSLDMDVAALTEPMTVCAEAVATAEIQAGQNILVIGPGFIGQGIAILARSRGANVVVMGRDDGPRLKRLAAVGFDHLIDTAVVDMKTALSKFEPFDAIIEAAGVPTLVAATLPFLKKRGIFTIVGIHPKPAEIDLTSLVRMHQQIRGSYRAPATEWDAVIAFLDGHQDLMRHLISHTLPLTDALAGFDAAHDHVASKVILRMGDV